MQGKYTKMLDRTGTETGEIKKLNCYPCRMEGCTGVRIHVKWPDGRRTYPCSKGCKVIDDDTLQIT